MATLHQRDGKLRTRAPPEGNLDVVIIVGGGEKQRHGKKSWAALGSIKRRSGFPIRKETIN